MKKYNVLVYGSGAREHALAFNISQSPLLNKLFLALPNDGFKHLGQEIGVEKDDEIDLVVIGPEAPLIDGIVDYFKKCGIKCIGADKKWAQLEGSKSFAKEFMKKHDIPTAKYFVITKGQEVNGKWEMENGKLESCRLGFLPQQIITPIVIKADGLCGGKGVCICETIKDAKKTVDEFLSGKWGKASEKVIVEEKLEGEEISVMSLFDGETLLSFIPARDYKKLNLGQNAPNTGGMGAFCPVELTTQQEKDLKDYLKKLETALKEEKTDFTGVIYSGLILTQDGIKVLEYNMRFGDPEIQALLCHLNCDILEVFIKASEKKLNEVELKWKEGISVAVVVASQGYPENPKIGFEIKGVEQACEKHGTQVFYAGVKQGKRKKGKGNGKIFHLPFTIHNSLLSNGGRVLTVCKTESIVEQAREKIYKTIDEIEFKDKIYRNDIGL